MSILDEVMTFAEATEYLGKNPNYMVDLIKAGKLVEGEHYRSAGRVKLILRSVVEQLKGGNVMIKKSDINVIVEKIRKEALSKKKTPTGFVIGGEYIVYIKRGKLEYATSGSADGQKAVAQGDVVCMVAYYDTPDIKQECTPNNIINKITSALNEMKVEVY